jgi:hypothetical protein
MRSEDRYSLPSGLPVPTDDAPSLSDPAAPAQDVFYSQPAP